MLTFAAKAINEKTKINGYFYDIDFKDKVITFNVFDLNKKSSEVLNTGLISSIVEIVNNENVVSMTISNGKEEGKITFEKNDVNNGSDENSNAWKRFAYMLCKLTGKECSDVNEALVAFKDITLGDLVKIEDDLKLTITLDNTKARSQDNNEKEEYTIKLSYNAKVTITKPDETEDFSGFNYTLQDSYDINGENGLYKVTKYITEQDGVTGFGTNPSKFYFAYTIELDNDIDISEAKVKIPVKENPGEKDYNESKFDDDRKVTVLMEVTEEDLEIENGKYRDIIIEIDGVPTRVRIDFSDLELRRNSKFTVEALPAIDKSEFPDDGWYDTDNGYSVNVKQDENDEKRYIVTGVLPIFDDESDESYDITFDTDKSLYYLGLLLKANNKVNNENTGKINVKFFHGNEEDNQFIEIPDSEFSSTG